MINSSDIIIRKFEAKDRRPLRIISCETAFMGKPASSFFEGDEIIADGLTLYFTDYEPEACFVAEFGGRLIGYLTGAKNEASIKKIFNLRILPRLFIKAFMLGTFFKKKNVIFIAQVLSGLFKGEFNDPDFSKQYPAILHINIKDGYRDSGVGARLVRAYLDYLDEEKIAGVHLATISELASIFFAKQGFELLYKSRRSYFSHILHNDINIYFFGKQIGKV